MIDFSPQHIASLLNNFNDDALEHILSPNEYEQYYNSDLNDKNVLKFWLIKLVHFSKEDKGYDLYKESLRQIIASGKAIQVNAHFSGIDDIESLDKWRVYYNNFLINLWDYLFIDESYAETDLSQYRERIDREFVEFPHMPDLWRKAIYKKEYEE